MRGGRGRSRCAYIHLTTLGGILGGIGTITDTITYYAPRYTDASFIAIHPGMSRQEVLNTLGAPLEESWDYGCAVVAFQWTGGVHVYSPPSCRSARIPDSADRSAVLHVLGEPRDMVWMYSVSPDRTSYRERVIYLHGGTVVKKHSGMYFN
jgi:hypothetical protein